MYVWFLSTDGRVSAPGPEFGVDDDYEAVDSEFAFDWESPAFASEDLARDPALRVAVRAGYVPIGRCAHGGDPYFVRLADLSKEVTPLQQIYLDGVQLVEPFSIPADAIDHVADSMEELIRVAAFDKPVV